MAAKLLIFTTAAGRYTSYADLFQFCVEKAYPEYRVLVNKNNIEYSKSKYYSACDRYLTNPSCYSDIFNSEYYYITDIDMMIVPEKINILDFHLDEMKESGLCYSNTPRWKLREPLAENRLTGLHFCNNEWYGITEEQRDIEWAKLVKGKIGSGKWDDEMLLMRLAKNSGLELPPQRNPAARHHGIHLGTIRDHQDSNSGMREQVMSRVDKEKATYWLNLCETQEYRTIFSQIKDKQTRNELQYLFRICNQIVKLP